MGMNDLKSSLGSVQQAYHLEIKQARKIAVDFSVVSFEAVEELGEPTCIVVRASHPDIDLPRASLLNIPATFSINPPAIAGLPALGSGRQFQGVLTGFKQLSSTIDATLYEFKLESRLALLRNVPRCRMFLNQSVPEIIRQVLEENGFTNDTSYFQFKLYRSFAKSAIVKQWHESDLAFIQRLCRRCGIWFRHEQNDYHGVVVFADDFTAYLRDSKLTAPLSANAGLESVGAESVHAFETHTKVVPQSVMTRDYNHYAAPQPIDASINLATADKSTYGQVYAYGPGHQDKENAEYEARLRHEEALCQQVVYHGKSNVLGLTPSAVFKMDKVLPDADYGQLIIKVCHYGSRDSAYNNTYPAIPSDRIYRLPLKEETWPKISGTVRARVASTDNYPYAFIDQAGEYIVEFDFDVDDRPKGASSCRVRLGKAFAGPNQTGMHFPLQAGTEVAIAYENGDPDRPYIAHAHHDSSNVDLITATDGWLSRNEIRTQSNNKLRMEDQHEVEHIKLATEKEKSQLNLGHLVDAKKQQRGLGAELRTDGWVSVRGGKGVLISADAQPKANGQQLDMQPALSLLDQALQQTKALGDAANAAQAIAADYKNQQTLLNDTLKELKKAGILVSAPAGIGLVSGDHLQLTAAQNLIATAGGNADVSVLKKFTVAAGEAISLFAQKLGIKIFAAKGKVDIQAQSDEMALSALKDLKITSVDGKLILSAEKEVWIGAGGSYIKITPEGIENGTQGDILEKCAMWDKPGPASMSLDFPPLPKPLGSSCASGAIAGGDGFVRF